MEEARQPAALSTRLKPEHWFLILAVLLHLLYLPFLSPLRTTHGAERFLHIISYAMGLRGTPDQVPVSVLKLIRHNTHFRLTEKFGDQAQEWDRLLGKENYFFNPNLNPEYYRERARYPAQTSVTRQKTFLSAWEKQWRNISQSVRYPLEIEKTVPFRTTPTAANRPMLSYATFVAPAVIGLAAELPPRLLLYFMIASNVLVTLLLGYYLIKITPAMKWLFLYLLLLPTVCVHRSFIMTDALTLSLCFLFGALVLKFRHEGKSLSWKTYTLLIILAMMIATAKIAYFLIPAIVLLLPQACFPSRRARAGLVAAVLFVSIAAGTAWNFHATQNVYNVDLLTDEQHSQTQDSKASEKFHTQLARLEQQPVHYAAAVLATLVDMRVIQRWVGNVYFWVHYYPLRPVLDPWLVYAALASLFALAWLPAGDAIGFRLAAEERIMVMAIFLALFATILTIYYLGHAVTFDTLQPAHGFREIQFMQGRFLLPALPLLLLAAYRPFVWTGNKGILASRAALLLSFALLLVLNVMMAIQYAR